MPSHSLKSATTSTAEHLRDRLFCRKPTEESSISETLRHEIGREIERILDEKRLLIPDVALKPHPVSTNYTSSSAQTDVTAGRVSCDCMDKAHSSEYSSSFGQADDEPGTSDDSSPSLQTGEVVQAAREVVDQGVQASAPPPTDNNLQHRQDEGAEKIPPVPISTRPGMTSDYETTPQGASQALLSRAVASVPSTPLFEWTLKPRSAGEKHLDQVFLDSSTGEVQLKRDCRLPFHSKSILVRMPPRTVAQSVLSDRLCYALLATEMPFYLTSDRFMLKEMNVTLPKRKEDLEPAVKSSARSHGSSYRCPSTRIPLFSAPWHTEQEKTDNPGLFLAGPNKSFVCPAQTPASAYEGFQFEFESRAR